MVQVFLALNGSWKFKGFAEGNGEELGANKPDFWDGDWQEGTVPGTIHTDLMKHNLIPDPFKDLNESKAQWVAQTEWWYRKEFSLSTDFSAREVVELVFEGLDTFATVWLNGIKVGEANNMFTPWRFQIKRALKQGKNVVAVRFKPASEKALELAQKFGKYGDLHAENFSARPFVRKAQYSFGWDWGPTLPTVGIWKTACVVAFDGARLGYLSVLTLEISESKAKLKAIADVYAVEACSLTAKFMVEGFGKKLEQKVKGRFSAGQNSVECTFEIVQPHLWWPRGYGEPDLYHAQVELQNGEVLLDRAATKCGVRTVELVQEPDEEGKSFVFLVNKQQVFCKGACWIPADSFLPRVDAERYGRLLGWASDAGFNMMRVWGGGVYETDVFYDLCDQLGLLVWQDFMYACSAYPDDDWFLKAAKQEAEEVVRRLRGHPCIALWCGNNEIQWHHETAWKNMPRLFGLPIWDKVLPEVVGRLDGTRPYRPSTPYADDTEPNSQREGNRHNWEVWSKQVDYSAYLNDTGRFLSEFGWQAPPTLPLLSQYLAPADLQMNSPALIAHEKQVNGLKILLSLLALHYPVPENFGLFLLYAQLNQADALKTAVMHWRSRMFKTAGCLIWQFNDCWPVVSWSLIDYGGNPKPAYWAVKRACQPLIAPIIIEDGKVHSYVVNETSQTLEVTLHLWVFKLTGETLHNETKKLTVQAYSSAVAFQCATADLPLFADTVLATCLELPDKTVFYDCKIMTEPKDIQLPLLQVTVGLQQTGTKTFEVTLTSPVYAKAVHLTAKNLDAGFDDDFFDLIPNLPKTVKCKTAQSASAGRLREALEVVAYPFMAEG